MTMPATGAPPPQPRTLWPEGDPAAADPILRTWADRLQDWLRARNVCRG